MSKKLLSEILYSLRAHQVWLELKECFEKINGSRIYKLHRSIFNLTQGVSTVLTCYTKLKNLWDEYDSILPRPNYDCVKSKKDVKQMKYQWLLEFLIVLNNSYS